MALCIQMSTEGSHQELMKTWWRHVMCHSSLMTRMYWSALHCVVELHLLGLHREKMHQKTSGGVSVSCCFHGVWLIGSEVSWEGCACWGQTRGGHVMFEGSIQRTQQWRRLSLACLQSQPCNTCGSRLFADLHFPKRGTAENFWPSSWSLRLTRAEAPPAVSAR